MIKKVAVFNDLSGFGKCSLTAAIPVLSALGVSPHPVPTAVLTGQGGYPVFYCKDMTDMLGKYIKAWKANDAKFDAIYSGYLTGPRQIDYVLEFIKEFKKENTFLLVDPVMGDNGRVYSIFSEELLDKMKLLVADADLITPNLTEACLLAGEQYEDVVSVKDSDKLIDKVITIGDRIRSKSNVKQDVIITGVRTKEEDSMYIYNVGITNEGNFKIGSHMFNKSFSGTGDIFSSTMCGLKLNDVSTSESMNIANEFLYHSIADTMNDKVSGNDGIYFEKHLYKLIKERCDYERNN
ncbi:MAG: pyridoxamine kinase [Clostridia bacterium]|nr:pyridoxamine kinase [Clostridia bacterium]